MAMKTILFRSCFVMLAGPAMALAEVDAPSGREPRQTPLFVSGTEGYHTFRIPALITTKRGTLLAFCEGRKNGGGDSGDIDLVLRRSSDGGRTWSPLQIVWDDGPNTCGNACPVVDQDTGTIWLLMTHNLGEDRESEIAARTSKGTRTVWVSKSEDDGATWSPPREITGTAKRPDWTWYATGPGIGIQIRQGPHKGRLVIPCDHAEADTKQWRSHVIYSDDRGKTWRLGGSSPQDRTNECQVAELSDGRLMLNMRSADRGRKQRAICLSADGGATWSDFRYDATLIEPICQASLLAYPPGGGVLLFSNPAETTARRNLTVRLSRDDGKTWPLARTLYPGPAAYSCLAALPEGEVGCLYERGAERPYETITFARFTREWLGNDAERP
jgi:sialidase-1